MARSVCEVQFCTVSARRSLQESYLEVERQKAVMFATLNRARQNLQDEGAQVLRCCQGNTAQGAFQPQRRYTSDVRTSASAQALYWLSAHCPLLELRGAFSPAAAAASRL